MYFCDRGRQCILIILCIRIPHTATSYIIPYSQYKSTERTWRPILQEFTAPRRTRQVHSYMLYNIYCTLYEVYCGNVARGFCAPFSFQRRRQSRTTRNRTRGFLSLLLSHSHTPASFQQVNCPFYYKIGACRHSDRCSRLHHKPAFSPTLLVKVGAVFVLYEYHCED